MAAQQYAADISCRVKVSFLHSGPFWDSEKLPGYTRSGQTRIEPNEFKKTNCVNITMNNFMKTAGVSLTMACRITASLPDWLFSTIWCLKRNKVGDYITTPQASETQESWQPYPHNIYFGERRICVVNVIINLTSMNDWTLDSRSSTMPGDFWSWNYGRY